MDYSGVLNKPQYEAVTHTEGPLLIIAGAGSGKTRVLTYRTAYLLQEKNVAPWNIMAITFTNKAANEMRERINKLTGSGGKSVWISTFHSACARILRAYIDRIGYTSSFSIYDTDDSRQIIKGILSEMTLIDPKLYTPKRLAYIISDAKNRGLTAKDMADEASNKDEKTCAQIYKAYDETLFKNNALDFDDLLLKTIELFEKEPEVLAGYQERLKYIMVDEYQDTNGIQFRLVKMLSEKHRNICVVGDDDQSIYKFRGADIRNILDFEKIFPEAKVIKLEQNYRSTKNILNAANTVIKNNKERKAKKLWTDNEDGSQVDIREYPTGYDEAKQVVRDIERRSFDGEYDRFAVLYRTNAQSRLFEEQLIFCSIPYRLVGGINFYSRKEIKDVLAYLKTIDNGRDEIAVRRTINIPKRGIGAKSLEKIADFAMSNGCGFFEALGRAEEIPGLGKTGDKIMSFVLFIRKYRTLAAELTVTELIESVLKETGYLQELINEGTDEARERIENINELISKAETYQNSTESPSLSGFLQDVALVAEIENEDESVPKVTLMTLHSAKGLEFDNVYIVGMEDGLFPGYTTLFNFDESEMQEERRLFYVGITRARKSLKLTGAKQRMIRGETEHHRPSCFLGELPKEVINPGAEYIFENRGERRRPPAETGGLFNKNPYEKKTDLSNLKLKKADSLDYAAGDRVRHKKFGEGTVMDIKDGERDYEVTVNFDTAGQKRLFAAFAKLVKI